MTIKELLEKRAKLISDARVLLDTAEGEERATLTAEEQEQYDVQMREADELWETVTRLQRQEEAEASLERSMGRQSSDEDAAPPANGGDADDAEERTRAAAFGRFLRDGRNALTDAELRALQSDSDEAGGYLVTPQQWASQLIQAVDNAVFVRAHATTIPVTGADSLGAPSLDADPADPTWTSEIATGDEDSTMDFGKRELHPHPLAKLLKVSRKLLRQVASAETLVRDRLAYKFSVVQENAFLNGTGANQALGVFVESSHGISSDRDVSTGNTATSIKADGLKEAKYTLKGQYWKGARWCFHRDGMKQIDKLKDGEGRYLLQPSIVASSPFVLLDIPVDMSEYAPNTFTTGLYAGILACWAHYWIADALSIEIQRLVELYAATNQIGFIGRVETDGMPVLEEAFVRVKLA